MSEKLEPAIIGSERPSLFRPLADLYGAGDLFLLLVRRHLRVRFAQTAMGAIWVLLQPLMSAAIFSVLFGIFVKAPSDGLPYVAFAYPALVLWTLFAQGFERANTSFIADERLITKVYFPRLVLPLSAVCSTLVDFAISTILIFPICFIFGIFPGVKIVLAIFAVPPIVFLSAGLGTIFASWSIRYRDFRQLAPFLTQLWFYATPVVYSLGAVPKEFRNWVFVNPIAAPLMLFRSAFVNIEGPPLWAILLSYGEALGLIVLALFVFRGVERRMADWL